ncbi:hypothetical protein VZT92_008449 [Zoarces viviparus]|uniref:Uncharacterized protein n=1 Tax=Zoarces viviparus TaxID=48416 RepID=A0AAW1FGU3_ZOAVI
MRRQTTHCSALHAVFHLSGTRVSAVKPARLRRLSVQTSMEAGSRQLQTKPEDKRRQRDKKQGGACEPEFLPTFHHHRAYSAGTAPFIGDTLCYHSGGCGTFERLLSDGKRGREEALAGLQAAEVAVGMRVCWGGEEGEHERCGKTSSFVYGEVIGTLSLPGEATQASHSVSVILSERLWQL